MSESTLPLGPRIPARPTLAHRVGDQLALLVPSLEDMRTHEPLLAPILLTTLLNVAATFALVPAFDAALAQQPAGTRHAIEVWLWAAALGSPLLLVLKGLVFAGIVWAIAVLVGEGARLRPIMSTFLYGEGILATAAVYVALRLHLRGLERITSPASLRVPTGLDAVLRPDSPAVLALVQTLTVFHLAWFAFMVVMLRRVAGCSRASAFLGAGAAWAALILVAVLRTAFAS